MVGWWRFQLWTLNGGIRFDNILISHDELVAKQFAQSTFLKKKEAEKSIRRREKYFTRFLQALCRSEEIKSDQYFCDWLQNDDAKEFTKTTKAAEK